ncbi:DUF2911 domain-containing protein [Mucilaginibacter koreensis]
MKKLFTYCIALLCLAATLGVQAQGFKSPQASSGQTIVQDFGLGKVTVAYSRPNVKGRKVFADLAPYGQVWRTGANSATVITFTDEVSLAGNKVAPGEYGLFTIPNKDEWTIILNKNAKQWGAYTYKEADDVLRFKVKATKLKQIAETFTIQFADVLPTTCQLQLMWANTVVSIPMTTEINTRIVASIEEAMKGEKKPYFQAAQYYYENGQDLNKALSWINEADKANAKSPMMKLWKARIQLKMGDKAGAAATAREGARLAKESNNDEYFRLNEAVVKQVK